MARRKRDIPAQLRTASTASEMLQELANRTNHGQMALQAFIAVLQHAFNGQVAIVEVVIGTCGVDVKLHGCSTMAEQVEAEKYRDMMREHARKHAMESEGAESTWARCTTSNDCDLGAGHGGKCNQALKNASEKRVTIRSKARGNA